MTDLVSIPRDAAERIRQALLVNRLPGNAAMLSEFLDAPPEYVSIPIADARAIAKWRKGIGPSAKHLHPCALELDRMVASLPPEHPPWEPSEEQITAYCKRHSLPQMDRGLAAVDLIAAHAVFEGDPT